MRRDENKETFLGMMGMLTAWVICILVVVLMSGCSYKPPTTAEIQARSDAYVACKNAGVSSVQVTDVRDAMLLKLIEKLPGNDPCASIMTSGDQAQADIAQANADFGKKFVGTLGIVGGIVADNLGDKWLADSVGSSAGTHITGNDNQVAGNDINTTTTTTEISYAPGAE